MLSLLALMLILPVPSLAARRRMVQAAARLEKGLGPEHPMLADILAVYADLLRAMKRPADAAKLETRVREIRARFGPADAADNSGVSA